jgi:hypothetical protein
MRLESAHISNFRLLEDISLNFSTEFAKPLTVIRAEKVQLLKYRQRLLLGRRRT